MTTDKILDPIRKPTKHHKLCHQGQNVQDRTGDWFVADCDCVMRSVGPTWEDCEDAITEIKLLRGALADVLVLLPPERWRLLRPRYQYVRGRALEAQP